MKRLALKPCVISIVIYGALSFMVTILFINVERGLRPSNWALAFYGFVPVNGYFNTFMLMISILLSAAAAWKINIAIPKDVSGGDVSIKFFALVSPLLSIAASTLTIFKGIAIP